jgi:pyruvate/2-oxoglutarate dehydrogenase complex dihydrolipoamide dehydrogenase (E3) component
MPSTSYDAIVIGTGQAGPPLARRLVAAKMKVAVVERGLFGGTCVNTGCTPTKALVASAHAVQLARRASEYGFSTGGPPTVDMKKVKARKDAVVARSATGLEKSLTKLEGCTVYRGHARFESPREVRVGDESLSADRLFINAGGRALVPPKLPGLADVPFLTNSTMMDVDFLPRHLLVVGGSYVGLEFGQMYRRFGSEVTIIEAAPRLVPHEDEDVSAAVREILEREGIRVRVGAECVAAAKRGEDIAIHLACKEGEPDVVGSHLLLAVGRLPNTDDLGLEKAGVLRDDRGFIMVDDQLRTNVPGIWALGDCNGKGAFTHTAYNDFEIVAANLLDGDPRRVSNRLETYALFIDPPLGRVGMTEAQVRATGRAALIGTRQMSTVARAIEKGETQGFMKVLVDAESKRVLGASILGVGGDEAIHCLTDLMYAKAPYTVMQRAVHIHPTISELIPTVLGELKALAPA